MSLLLLGASGNTDGGGGTPSSEDWGLITDAPPATTEDWGLITDTPPATTADWGTVP